MTTCRCLRSHKPTWSCRALFLNIPRPFIYRRLRTLLNVSCFLCSVARYFCQVALPYRVKQAPMLHFAHGRLCAPKSRRHTCVCSASPTHCSARDVRRFRFPGSSACVAWTTADRCLRESSDERPSYLPLPQTRLVSYLALAPVDHCRAIAYSSSVFTTCPVLHNKCVKTSVEIFGEAPGRFVVRTSLPPCFGRHRFRSSHRLLSWVLWGIALAYARTTEHRDGCGHLAPVPSSPKCDVRPLAKMAVPRGRASSGQSCA
ncbi:hypothetical protein F5148DRAFT_512655 [Russula earlei]|uniref:Uncharacterized protein n=1 Tax=Russula earlei TaxID=71964 RepID=A0ACC0TYK5_9AGAM|nr:hypothetical protein F5148DRAFT_512655 [Russula earlei]